MQLIQTLIASYLALRISKDRLQMETHPEVYCRQVLMNAMNSQKTSIIHYLTPADLSASVVIELDRAGLIDWKAISDCLQREGPIVDIETGQRRELAGRNRKQDADR